jgi:ferredoxin
MIRKMVVVFIVSFIFIACDSVSRESLISGNGPENDDNSAPDETVEKDNPEPDEVVGTDEEDVPDENETPDIVEVPDENILNPEIYYIDSSRCNGCRRCIGSCNYDALSMSGFKAVIDPLKCTGCGDCAKRCPRGAIKKSE